MGSVLIGKHQHACQRPGTGCVLAAAGHSKSVAGLCAMCLSPWRTHSFHPVSQLWMTFFLFRPGFFLRNLLVFSAAWSGWCEYIPCFVHQAVRVDSWGPTGPEQGDRTGRLKAGQGESYLWLQKQQAVQLI